MQVHLLTLPAPHIDYLMLKTNNNSGAPFPPEAKPIPGWHSCFEVPPVSKADTCQHWASRGLVSL